MAIENYPVWTFSPNWDTPFTETLEWLTDILASDDGSEQRRSMRYMPRRSFDYGLVAGGPERSFLDNMLVALGTSKFYFPMWHDVSLLTAAAAPGDTTLACADDEDSLLSAGDVAILLGATPFDYELVEIASAGANLDLASTISGHWPRGTRLMPVKLARLLEQPSVQRLNDVLGGCDIQMQLVEKQTHVSTLAEDAGLSVLYGGFYLLPIVPNERESTEMGYERRVSEFDPETAPPVWSDISKRAFTTVPVNYTFSGRAEHARIASLLNFIRGRAIPLWVPTFNTDFVVVEDVEAGDVQLIVERSGFTDAGGPNGDRQYILIETSSTKTIRKITNSANASDGTETLLLDEGLPADMLAAEVVRVSFVTLMRLSSDVVEIEHNTDNIGVSEMSLTFRSAPNSRTPTAGF